MKFVTQVGRIATFFAAILTLSPMSSSASMASNVDPVAVASSSSVSTLGDGRKLGDHTMYVNVRVYYYNNPGNNNPPYWNIASYDGNDVIQMFHVENHIIEEQYQQFAMPCTVTDGTNYNKCRIKMYTFGYYTGTDWYINMLVEENDYVTVEIVNNADNNAKYLIQGPASDGYPTPVLPYPYIDYWNDWDDNDRRSTRALAVQQEVFDQGRVDAPGVTAAGDEEVSVGATKAETNNNINGGMVNNKKKNLRHRNLDDVDRVD